MPAASDFAPLLCSPDDADLAARLKRRDLGAIEVLYRRLGKLLFALVLNVVADRGTAEDVTAEIFMKAFNLAETLPEYHVCLGAWMLILARNHALQYKRLVNSRSSAIEKSSLESPALFKQAASPPSVEGVAAMRDAFLHLSDGQRLALELAWYEGLTLPQIASRLEKPVETVRAFVLSALDSLRGAGA